MTAQQGYFGEGPAGRDYPVRLARAKALARYFGLLGGPHGALPRERGKMAGAVRSTR
jgi:hypothetical protein